MLKLYRKLFKYVPERKIWAYLAMILSASAVIIYMFSYWFLWKALVSMLVDKNYPMAMENGIWVVILMIIRGILEMCAVSCSHYLAFRLETNLRKKGLHGLLDASFSFYDTNESGEIRKVIDDNAANTHRTVAHLIPDNVTGMLTPICMMILMTAIDWRLTVLMILTIAIGIWQYFKMYGGEEFMKNYNEALKKMSSATVEYVRGMQVIKIFGVTVEYYKALIDSIRDYRKFAYDYSLSCRKPFVNFQVLFNVFYAFAVPLAVIALNLGEPAMLTLAKVVFFAIFSGVVFVSFSAVMFTGQDNFQARFTVDQLEKLLDEMDDNKLVHGNRNAFRSYDIEFSHVDFKYEDNYVLKDFNLKLEEGKTYALVGSSGGGKSTIAKLISGFYPVDGGHLLIGGEDIRSYTEEALTRNISFVFQNSKLFKTSIYENVKLGNPDAGHDEIMKALEWANCNSILAKFPERENTVIGSKGVYLSGGEVQRIAIARAILKNAEIVIMDEASAAADPENEYELQTAFSRLMKGKTVIMIAHRLSSIRNVDRILFVEDGKVREEGTHEELMKRKGRYFSFQEIYSSANEWRLS